MHVAHFKRFRSRIVRGKHSRCLCGPGEGFGACAAHRHSSVHQQQALWFVWWALGSPCCPPALFGCAMGMQPPSETASHDTHAGAPTGGCTAFAEDPYLAVHTNAREGVCWQLRVARFRERTKMPPSLSSIQCFGALSRFRCFLGPRGMLGNHNHPLRWP